jgi:two-component system, OmpR family, response regulator
MLKSADTPRSQMRAGLPRILVVDANPGYRSVISHVVEMAGAQFESVAEIAQAMRQLDGTHAFDMIIVGTSTDSPLSPAAIGKLRSVAVTPVIVLVEAYDETKETLRFYKAGADEVLPKPFVPDALIGAIQAEMRRPGPISLVPLATRIELGSLVFDAKKRRVTGTEGSAVPLTKREWQLLAFFLASPNQFFSAAEAASQAWDPEASPEQFRSYVTRLRHKLSPFKPYCSLVTEKGKGYCLVVDQPPTTH